MRHFKNSFAPMLTGRNNFDGQGFVCITHLCLHLVSQSNWDAFCCIEALLGNGFLQNSIIPGRTLGPNKVPFCSVPCFLLAGSSMADRTDEELFSKLGDEIRFMVVHDTDYMLKRLTCCIFLW